jgi:uncharacterized protein DUF3617
MAFKHLVLTAAALALFAPGAALAAHGKAGLWSSTSTVAMNGMPPRTTTATYCMTQAQVTSDKPPPSENHDCTMLHERTTGHTMSADMVCKGSFNATGHFESTFDSDTHYTTKITMRMEGMATSTTIDGHWVKTDCGGAMH